ncbi:protein of unknown function [Amycolatopsis marina]|uniref:DUF397 domain-containing protein n=1 Tax=Amycolatopsis marina TaxID=490629 RepID=A0A1I1BZP8_9PSEU|nr:DUF397 domain-containing protein [Amycolatopsis marina]SFB55741.1 protein of unknown function [Amycolatopsis marina]
MDAREQPDPHWHKSSYSGGGNGNCVEVALTGNRAAVRDSKDTTGTPLSFPTPAWQAFLTTLTEHHA